MAVRPSWLSLRIQDAGGTDLDLSCLSFDDLEGQTFSAVVRKAMPDGVFAFFSLDGLRNGFDDEVVESTARTILVLDDFARFASGVCAFLPLDGVDPLEVALGLPDDVPRSGEVEAGKLTRNLTRHHRPPRLAFWVQTEAPTALSAVWHAWSYAAATRLVFVPVNELWEDEGGLCIALSGPKTGPRKRTLRAALDRHDTGASFPVLNEAVSWLVQVPREASVRHTYLTAELAREWPVGCPNWAEKLPERLPVALEGAKAHYEAHLLETSSDMLKSLADLRKAVNDETGKAIDRTQSLLSALAGSLAAALGTVLLRLPALLTTTTVAGDRQLSQILFGLLAAWMLFVCAFSLTTNHKFRVAMNASRKNWHTKVHAVLSNTEFDQMATEPLRRAELVYNWAAVVVAVVYVLTAAALAVLACDPFVKP